MNSSFNITTDWISSENGPAELRETSALLAISFGDLLATRALDEWSKTVQPSVRLSAYPLALWFASSWWRLLWEPSIEGPMRLKPSWRLAHEMPAAGYGFIWPRLIFESDGHQVDVHSYPSAAIGSEPVKYLERFDVSVPMQDFERGMERFISLVISRLDAVKISQTDLHGLWEELNAERADADTSRLRRLEARLGFDPDDSPSGLVQRLEKLTNEAGAAAIEEIAPACAGDDPSKKFSDIVKISKMKGVQGEISVKPARGAVNTVDDSQPWRWSKNLALRVRKQVSAGKKPVSDKELADLLGIQAATLATNHDESAKPLGLAVLNGHPGKAKFIFRRKGRTARRFEAARFLADSIVAPKDDRWLPETDAKTARQKAQRAFAVEFLCPIEALKDFLDGDYSSNDALNDAAEHFGISLVAVTSQLQNNGLIGATSGASFE